MRYLRCLTVQLAIALFFALAATPLHPSMAQTLSSSSDGGKIQSIIINGTQRIEPGTIRSYMVLREGGKYTPRGKDRTLKSLFSTGLFADVSINWDGSSLIVNIVENPIINRIAFEGNHSLENDTLDAEIILRPRVIYTRSKIQSDVKRLLTIYRKTGRFSATVEPKVIQLPQNRVDLVFEINEGNATEVNSIRFVGNSEFGDSKLRGVVRTKETEWYGFLSSDDNYDPDRIVLDRELLRRFYLSEGYADFRVLSAVAELTPDQKDFFITFTLQEGPRYRFGNIDVAANIKDLNSDEIATVIDIDDDEWYDANIIDKTIDAITDKVGELGFAFVDVRPQVKRNDDGQTIDIVFQVNEGPRVFVERINIEGNVRTKDQVIRREFRLVEGDAFNSAKIRRSKQRITDLDFFETVSVEREQGSSPDKTVVNVEVEEKSTGSFSIGAGFSTSAGVLGEIGLEEKNFLGQGQEVNVKVIFGQKQEQYRFSFTEPYFMDRDVRAGFDLFSTSTDLQDESSHDKASKGIAFRAGYPITEDLGESWKYTYKIDETTNVSSSASSLIQAAAKEETISEITHAWSYSSLDVSTNPSKGVKGRFVTNLAGLGGTSKYLRNTIDAVKYYSITDYLVFSVKGSAGYIVGIGEDVSFVNRYTIGGDDLRGFADAGVGPRDTSTDDALGGEWKYTGALQLDFPLGLPDEFGIGGRAFTDFGSAGDLSPTNSTTVDDGSIRVSVGVGLSWQSPLGPVGLDVGFPILKENYDETEVFRVNFGTRF